MRITAPSAEAGRTYDPEDSRPNANGPIETMAIPTIEVSADTDAAWPGLRHDMDSFTSLGKREGKRTGTHPDRPSCTCRKDIAAHVQFTSTSLRQMKPALRPRTVPPKARHKSGHRAGQLGDADQETPIYRQAIYCLLRGESPTFRANSEGTARSCSPSDQLGSPTENRDQSGCGSIHGQDLHMPVAAQ